MRPKQPPAAKHESNSHASQAFRPSPPQTRAGSQARAGPVDRLRGDQRGADVELEVLVGAERHVARVSLEELAGVHHGDLALGRAYLARAEGLPPFVEELAERVGALNRRLDVNDAVGRV